MPTLTAEHAHALALDLLHDLYAECGEAFAPDTVRKSAAHAPAGGVSIGGKPFAGGEFIPGDVMAGATPEEKEKVEGGGTKTKHDGGDDDPVPVWDGTIDQGEVTRQRGSAEHIAEWNFVDDGNNYEQNTHVETGEYDPFPDHPDSQPVEVYRWYSQDETGYRSDEGEWVSDENEARTDAKRHARRNHEEPAEPEEEDSGGDDDENGSVEIPDVEPAQKRDVTLGAEKIARSDAQANIAGSVDEDTADEIVHRIFGGERGDYQSLMESIGMPDDAEVTVVSAGKYEPLFSDDEPMPGAVGVRLEVSHPKMDRVSRFVGIDGAGKRFIKNEIVEIKKQYQGEGMGEDIFARQVEAASSEGIDYIATHAAGAFGGSMNGYYTWPSFGYDQELDDDSVPRGPAIVRARQKFPDAKSVLDVMALPAVDLTPEEHAETVRKLNELDAKLKKPAKERTTITGADWWKVNGSDLHNARFDLDPKSRSVAILAARRKRAKAVMKSYSAPSKKPSATTFGRISKSTGSRPLRADPHDDLLAAAIDHAEECLRDGTDAQPGLDALADLSDDEVAEMGGAFAKAVKYDESKHPRGKNGRYISKDRIDAAKSDPKLAAQLKDEVKPEDAGKLDDALAGKTDLGRTARGRAKHEAGQRREAKAASRDEARRISTDIMLHPAARTPENYRALIPHLSTLTGAELANLRVKLGASFGGERKVDGRRAALLEYAQNAALSADYARLPAGALFGRQRRDALANGAARDAEDAGIPVKEPKPVRSGADDAAPTADEFVAASTPAPRSHAASDRAHAAVSADVGMLSEDSKLYGGVPLETAAHQLATSAERDSGNLDAATAKLRAAADAGYATIENGQFRLLRTPDFGPADPKVVDRVRDAFAHLDTDGYNFVGLHQVRELLPDVPLKQLHAAAMDLRRSGEFVLGSHEHGGRRIEPEKAGAAIREEGEHLLNLSRRHGFVPAQPPPESPSAPASAPRPARQPKAPKTPAHVAAVQKVADAEPDEEAKGHLEAVLHNWGRRGGPHEVAEALGRAAEESYLAHTGAHVARTTTPATRAAVDRALTALGATPHGPVVGQPAQYSPLEHESPPPGQSWFPGHPVTVVRQPLAIDGRVVSRGVVKPAG